MPAVHVHPVSKQSFVITKLNSKTSRGTRALSAPIEGSVHIPSDMSEVPNITRSISMSFLQIYQENGILYIHSGSDFLFTRERTNKLLNHLESLVRYTPSSHITSYQRLHDCFVFNFIEERFFVHFRSSKPVALFKDDLLYLIEFLECAYLSI